MDTDGSKKNRCSKSKECRHSHDISSIFTDLKKKLSTYKKKCLNQTDISVMSVFLFELLHPQVGNPHGAGVGLNPVDNLARVVTVALNAEVGLAVVGEVALGVGAEAGGAGAFGQLGRVRPGEADGGDRVLNNVETLEAGRGLVLRGEAQPRAFIGTSAVD